MLRGVSQPVQILKRLSGDTRVYGGGGGGKIDGWVFFSARWERGQSEPKTSLFRHLIEPKTRFPRRGSAKVGEVWVSSKRATIEAVGRSVSRVNRG